MRARFLVMALPTVILIGAAPLPAQTDAGGRSGLSDWTAHSSLSALRTASALSASSALSALSALSAFSARSALDADPADSLYKTAREALDRGQYQRAADLFREVRTRYAKSPYAPDAYYWEAFALYRAGGTDQLRKALDVLRLQREQFPKAATQGDAKSLDVRIRGELAQRGDANAAASVTEQATTVGAAPPAPPPPPSRPPAPARAPAPSPPSAPSAPPVASPSVSCRDDEDDTRIAALNALLQMDASRAMPILEKVLARRDSGSVCLRRKAVFLVSQQETPQTEQILLNAIRNDPDPEVQEQAVFWLSQVGSERAVSALDSILQSSKSEAIQEKAIFALSQMDNPRASAIIRSYAQRIGAPVHLREQAIFWLGQQGGSQNEAFLRALYKQLKDEDLKEKVIFSVSQMEGPETERWLMDLALDGSEPVETRKQALFWAGQSGVSISELAAFYARTSDIEMKEQVIFVYSQRDEKAAVDQLLDIAKREPNLELRKKAIFWLSQSDDPRAAKFLEDLIQQ